MPDELKEFLQGHFLGIDRRLDTIDTRLSVMSDRMISAEKDVGYVNDRCEEILSIHDRTQEKREREFTGVKNYCDEKISQNVKLGNNGIQIWLMRIAVGALSGIIVFFAPEIYKSMKNPTNIEVKK